MKTIDVGLLEELVCNAISDGLGVIWHTDRKRVKVDDRVIECYHPVILLAIYEGFLPTGALYEEMDFLADERGYCMLELVEFGVGLFKEMMNWPVQTGGGYDAGKRIGQFLKQCCVIRNRAAVTLKKGENDVATE